MRKLAGVFFLRYGIAYYYAQWLLLKDHISQALKTLFTQPRSFLLHVSIDELENVWPLVPPGAGNETMLEKSS